MPPREPGPPAQVDAASLADHLEVITKAVFQAGMSWDVVEGKWDGFREAFHGFDVEKVAAINPDEVEQLAQDTRIIRNRRKIQATIDNAESILELEEQGGYETWLDSQGDFLETVKALGKRFSFLGGFGSYYYLYVVKRPVPPHDEAQELLRKR